MATISEALAMALQHHQAGRLAAAERIYRQILQTEPNHADAIHLLGVLAHQVGKHDLAVEYISRAIALKGGEAEFHYHLTKAYHALGRRPEAVASCRRALDLKPDFAHAHDYLGLALKDQGKLDEAIACFRRALELTPDTAGVYNNLGLAFQEQTKLDEAAACYRRALELQPDLAEVHGNLGNALKDQGKLTEAVASYRRALELKPGVAATHYNLGLALMDQGKLEDAAARFRQALQLDPHLAEAHNSLGLAFEKEGKLDDAIACFGRALELDPSFAMVHNNLGLAFKAHGRLDEAIACLRRALELKPDFSGAHSNLVYAQMFSPGCDEKTLWDEHRRWSEWHAAPVEKLSQPHRNDRSPERRLRVGYVSPNFCDHVVGRNLLPLIREHDHRQFEIICYSDTPRPDDLTSRFRERAEGWRETGGLSEAALAQRIREDRIDVLVNTTLHMIHSRLLVFARRPAPVQVTFAGYPGTTGLSPINYRLTDPNLDPPGLHDHCYAEESIRLPDTFWCYDPLESEPAVNALPAAERKYVTFGCLNNFCKMNPCALRLWARVLKAVDRSRLLLLAEEGSHRRRTLNLLEEEGVAPERIAFAGPRMRPQYLRLYQGINVGLDTIPYNGHTTSLDSAWMGVPVVTLVGSTVVGRAGLSQLRNLGLPELIASTPEQYVRIAADLAQDLPRLSRLRATLRERMAASPLMDAPRFARSVEAAYREMWHRWCAK